MTKSEFMAKLFVFFKNYFDKDNSQVYIEAYNKVFTDKLDYEKMYENMILNWSGKTPPSPAWFRDNRVYLKSDEKPKEFITIKATKNGIEYEFWANHYNYDDAIKSIEKRGLQVVTAP